MKLPIFTCVLGPADIALTSRGHFADGGCHKRHQHESLENEGEMGAPTFRPPALAHRFIENWLLKANGTQT